MHKVKVTIGKSGVQVEVDGMSGGGCKEATAALEKALGKTTATVDKPEMFEQTGQGQEQSIGGGW